MSAAPLDSSERPIEGRGWGRLWRRLRHAERAHAGHREAARQLYDAVVRQARKPVWYRDLGVPDTPEGRFEMIALHAALVLRRLRREGVRGQGLGQQLFDLMFVDLDGGLRELGVSDLSVGSYVKRLAGNFYARLAALEEGLGAGAGATSLRPMLRANVYHGSAPDDAQVAGLARCLTQQDRVLAEQDGAALSAGMIVWIEPLLTIETQEATR